MIIVVEGPDGAGKSTLIDNLRLCSKMHYVTLRRSGPPNNLEQIRAVIRWIEQFDPSSLHTLPLILDRHPFISEAIYGPALRGSSLLMNYYTMHDLEYHFHRFIKRVIYCRPPTSVITQKMQNNPQLAGVTERIEEITSKYDFTMKMVRHWGIDVVEYDWTIAKPDADLSQYFFGSYV